MKTVTVTRWGSTASHGSNGSATRSDVVAIRSYQQVKSAEVHDGNRLVLSMNGSTKTIMLGPGLEWEVWP